MTIATPSRIEKRAEKEPTLLITGSMEAGYETILSPAALRFVGRLAHRHGPAIRSALARREARRRSGDMLQFLPHTADIRAAEWRVADPPADLRRRIVEITGPVQRKMIINALNSGADVFMADFEDSNSPTWANVVEGQIHLRDAVRRSIRFHDPRSGKDYRLAEEPATLVVRPRGLHLSEAHAELDGGAVPACLFDFGLFFFHNARELIERGSGPYFYLPKLESHLEARIWNEVFIDAQEALGIPRGTIRATVLIETLPAAFEMDEILYELREHSTGLNCGRWDYIFSFIKFVRDDPEGVFPDRSQVTMVQPCMRAYTLLAIKTCHRRGAHAMGGMAAQIPIKNDPEANQEALDRVRADKEREAADGHDGTWVAHPGLVQLAREVFEAHLAGPHQIERLRDDVEVSEGDLLRIPTGTITEDGLRLNIRVGIRYVEAWLRGVGCVPLYNLMEDAATAEISRTQVWQWVHHGSVLEDGRRVDHRLLDRVIEEEMVAVKADIGAESFDGGRFPEAVDLFRRLCTGAELAEFLTIPAYEGGLVHHQPPHDGATPRTGR
ncbi:MAG: malate synthase A [Gemmatimonadota bacterium]